MFHLQKTQGICQFDSKEILNTLSLSTSKKEMRSYLLNYISGDAGEKHSFWRMVYTCRDSKELGVAFEVSVF